MKVLVWTSPASGHLFPVVPILLELHQRGHEVVVVTVGEQGQLLRGLGISATALPEGVSSIAHDDYLARTQVTALRRSIATLALRADADLDAAAEAISRVRPDVVLVDTNAWGAAIAAEAWGGPWATFLPFPTPLPDPAVPPFGAGFPPATGRTGRLRDAALRPVLTGAFERTMLPPLNRLRTRAGLRPVRDVTDAYLRPPLTLYLTSVAFEHPRSKWPDSFCFTGPMSWEPPAEGSRLLPIDGPLVLVTTSSEYQADEALARAAVAASWDDDITVIVTMPAGVPDGIDTPPNIRVVRFAPHSQLLTSAVCAVTHGGMGATQKALAAGVPVVAVPFGRDQAEVASRLVRSGAGITLQRRKLTPDRLQDAVQDATARRPAAENLARQMTADGGAPLAADRLVRLNADS